MPLASLIRSFAAWWHSLVGLPPLSPPFDPAHPPALLAFSPPDFPSLAAWPALRQVVTGRWRQVYDWHNTRKKAGLEASLHHDRRTGQVVAELERELGRKARPCSLDLVLLPVRDEQVRAVPVSSMSAQIVNVPQFQASYHASKAGVSMLAQALGSSGRPAACG
jgi:NAD(P)-dependent dehydrogenase (short-subunit alcohol dehydrogenase family)